MLTTVDLQQQLGLCARETETLLSSLLDNTAPEVSHLFDSMRYSVLAGGKRVRPFLVLETCRALGGDAKKALHFAAALEMIHTYSLIHDDLPCMDNDDLRRGKPTNHKVFGEYTAVIAGDALQSLAFESLTYAPLSSEQIVAACRTLGKAAGALGMCGGQIMDMDAERECLPVEKSLLALERLHGMKTGALIDCACKLGMIAAGSCDEKSMRNLQVYARNVGLVFQIVDDLLDLMGDSAELGKNVGTDAASGKMTFLSYMTEEEAFAHARVLTEEAVSAANALRDGRLLADFAVYLLNRKK